MKKIFISSIIIFFTMNMFSQEENADDFKTIFGNDGSNGGYGGFSFGYASVANRDAVILGGRGAWIIDHCFALGMGGEGYVSDKRYISNKNDTAYNYAGGQGGILLEPIIFPNFPVHLSVPVLCGAGGIAYARSIDNKHNSSWDHYVEDTETYVFIKPGIEIELNLTRHVRLSIGAYYLYTSKIILSNTSKDALNNYSGMISLKFGDF
jgi:hypothetical protein